MVKNDPSQYERLTITVEQAAKVLGIGRTLAYDLAKRGELPGVIRIGSRYVVSRPKLDQWLMSKADLTVLCRDCHGRYHGKLARHGAKDWWDE